MKLCVLMVSNQVRGIDGTGGLGDVATGLAKALASREDVDVRILMPGFKTVSGRGIADRFDKPIATDIPVPFGDQWQTAHVCRYFLPTINADEPRIPATCFAWMRLIRQPTPPSRRSC